MKRGIRLPLVAAVTMTLGVLYPTGTYADVGTAAEAAGTTTTVRTKSELLTALAGAVAGDTVFVAGTASIDLTGTKSIAIPAGVTLASDRGQNGSLGGLLYNDELDLGQSEVWSQFSVRGNGVRMTGLRLRGPDPEIRDNAYQYDNSRGLDAVAVADLLVDNNELSGWSHAAVSLNDSVEARVRNNYLHHNRRTGLGYGVLLANDSSALIEENIFTQNRHAIAGSGIRTQRYDARFNVVTDNARSHGFDMHGENEALGNGAPYAGDVIHIKQNSFNSDLQPAVVIRGRPFTGGWVSGNCFAHTSSSTAVQQKNFTGNLFIGANTYGTSTGTCHQATGTRPGWRFSSGGSTNWAPLRHYTLDVSEVGFGDFNGDGRTDVFRAGGARWYYSPGGTGALVPLASSGTQVASLRFGDFDGDGRTDVFQAAGGQWRFSPGGAGSWQTLASSTATVESLRFGDFDADGRTDVFQTNGTQWFYSSGGQTSLIPLMKSSLPITSLAFGDFDGDRRTDVFSTSGGQWQYSPGGSGAWQPLARSSAALDSLRFGDFNADGRTDVFAILSGQWRYSSGGASSWISLATANCPLASLYVGGDFDGDRKADVFDGRCGG